MKVEVLNKEVVLEAKADIRIQLENKEEILALRNLLNYYLSSLISDRRLVDYQDLQSPIQRRIVELLLDRIPKVT